MRRYLCKNNQDYFSIDYQRKPVFWIPHIDGISFRKLGDEHGLSGKQVFLKVQKEINTLPDNTSLTKTLCSPFYFSGILIIDGKYVAVKGYQNKIPFIYGIDYLSHDIPLGGLFPAEDEMAFVSFFARLKELGYVPQSRGRG